MRNWLSSLAVVRVPELALGLAAGYALAIFLRELSDTAMGVIAQNVGRNPYGDDTVNGLLNLLNSPYYLYFNVGRTVIAYGPILSSALALALVGLVGWVVLRRRDRVLGECPSCASRIPHTATHCAYCGSAVER